MPNVYKVVIWFKEPRWAYYTYLVVGVETEWEAIAKAKSQQNCEYLSHVNVEKIEEGVIEVGFELY